MRMNPHFSPALNRPNHEFWHPVLIRSAVLECTAEQNESSLGEKTRLTGSAHLELMDSQRGHLSAYRYTDHDRNYEIGPDIVYELLKRHFHSFDNNMMQLCVDAA